MKSEGKMLLLGPWFWEGFSSFLVSWFNKGRFAVSMFQVPLKMPLTKVNLCSEVQEIVEEEGESPSLLDLPELALECILERLSPAELCSMAGVCNSLRDRCRSDHLWEKHLKHKWGRVICEAACKEWQCHIASRKRPSFLDQRNQKGFFGSLMSMWPFSWYKSQCESRNKPTTCLPVDSIMALYLSLESGKFWFPAQVYNREVRTGKDLFLILILRLQIDDMMTVVVCSWQFSLLILFFGKFNEILSVFGFRMDMLDLCYHVMMHNLAMIPRQTPFRQGMERELGSESETFYLF